MLKSGKILITFILFILLSSSISGGKYHPAIKYVFPLPDSRYLTPNTTIILKLEEEYLSSVSSLDSMITVTGDSLNPLFPPDYNGNAFWSTDQRTIIFDPDRNLKIGGEIKVKINTSQFGLQDFEYTFRVVESGSNPPVFESEQLEGDTQANTIIKQEVTDPVIINDVVLPNDFPQIISHVNNPESIAEGNIFMGLRLGYARMMIITDNKGAPYFFRNYPINGNVLLHYTEDYPEGILSAYMGPEKSYYVFNDNMEQIDSYNAGHGYITDNHELQFLPNGHALIIAGQDVTVDMSQLVEGGRSDASVWGKHIQELDKDHNVVFEWRSWDHYNITDATFISMTGPTIDYVHMNTIEVDYDGNYLLSPKTLDEITKINSETGEVIWRLGGENNQFQILNDPDYPFSWQHDVRSVPGKPDEYTMFDNGNNRDPQFSRAVHYKLDTAAMTAELLWQYRYDPDIYAGQKGSVQILPNGNYYIDWSADGLKVIGTEVTPQGELAFEIRVPSAKTYRTQKYEWYPVVEVPQLIIENYETTIRLIYNKFGDKSVSGYNVYYGVSPNPATLLTTTQIAYYDLDVSGLAGGKEYYFRVTSVDSSGMESDYSNEESVTVSGSGIEPGENMVFNNDFSLGFDFWEWNLGSDADAGYEIDSLDQLHIMIENGGNNYSDVKVGYSGLSLNLFKKYLFEFDAYAESSRLIDAEIRKRSDPDKVYSKIGLTNLSRGVQRFSHEFIMESATTNEAEIQFNVGNSSHDVFIDNVVVKQVVTTDIEDEALIPQNYSLEQNYPNPFNPSTRIKYSIPRNESQETVNVKLIIYDILGKEVATLVNEKQISGNYEVVFSANGGSTSFGDNYDLVSGIYFYRLQVGAGSLNSAQDFIQTKKMVLLR